MRKLRSIDPHPVSIDLLTRCLGTDPQVTIWILREADQPERFYHTSALERSRSG